MFAKDGHDDTAGRPESSVTTDTNTTTNYVNGNVNVNVNGNKRARQILWDTEGPRRASGFRPALASFQFTPARLGLGLGLGPRTVAWMPTTMNSPPLVMTRPCGPATQAVAARDPNNSTSPNNSPPIQHVRRMVSQEEIKVPPPLTHHAVAPHKNMPVSR